VIGGIAMNATQMLVIAIIMPTIVRDIGGASFYTWAAMLYTIGSIVGGASTGMVWSRLGARRAYTLGAGVFALGTVCCALAPDIGALIAARGVQGWAGGLVSGSGMALITGVFDSRLRTRIIAISQGTFTACHLSGPIVGGMFAAMQWWRGSFWMMAPLMLVCRALLLEDPGPAQPRARTDPLRPSAVSPVRNLGRRRDLRRGERIHSGDGAPRPLDCRSGGARRCDVLARRASRR
jgi:MFS family permease